MTFYDEPGCCAICGANGYMDPLDKHHVFGGSNRKKSEKYGAVVRLCHKKCHEFGKQSVHQNHEIMQAMHEEWQRRIMEEQGWNVDEFRLEFGKSWI